MSDLYDIRDDRFRDLTLTNARLMRISSGHLWTEGPVWMPAAQCLYFSDIPNNRIHRWVPEGDVSTFRSPSNFTNGHTRDAQGRLISCQHGTRSVTRTEHDGCVTTLAKSYDGNSLNSPNDVVVKSDGSIWFTDPTYGIMSNYEGGRREQEQPSQNVYRLDPNSGDLSMVCDSFVQPNGLAFSPDEQILYIAESGASHAPGTPAVVRAFDVDANGVLSNERDFIHIEPGLPDGLRVDYHGNLWISSRDSVQVFDDQGLMLGKILVPECVSNLCFGGPRNNQLFITATTSVYAIYINSEAPGTVMAGPSQD